MMNIFLWMVLSFAILAAVAWTLLGARLIRLSLGPSFQFFKVQSEPDRTDLPTITAIVPARNEEANVEATVRALQAQDYPNLTILLIDDQSTDATASILERLTSESSVRSPLRFIKGVERPEGWVGKTWAVHQGAREAEGEWLWFVDADMGLDPRALISAVEAAQVSGADLVSLLPGVRCRTFWQGTIAASLVQLLGQLYPLDRVNDPTKPEAIAAGGFILVRRQNYWLAGGHEAVRSEIIEDIQLSSRVKATGGKLLVRLAPDVVWTHMYGSFGEIWRGLRKNAYAGMEYMPHRFVVGALIALTLAWAPWVSLGLGLLARNGPALMIGLWGLLAQVLATAPILVFLRLPFPFAFTLPCGISAYVAIATSSVWHYHRGRILWKDRAISSKVTAPRTNAATREN